MNTFSPTGVCTKQITFDVQDDRIKNVIFHGGCDGNLQGIAKLVEGLPAHEVIARLKGIRCGSKTTSCPDQLQAALEEAAAMAKTN